MPDVQRESCALMNSFQFCRLNEEKNKTKKHLNVVDNIMIRCSEQRVVKTCFCFCVYCSVSAYPSLSLCVCVVCEVLSLVCGSVEKATIGRGACEVSAGNFRGVAWCLVVCQSSGAREAL